MLSVCENKKVFRPVVPFVSIDVMDDFIPSQGSSNSCFHKFSVFVNSTGTEVPTLVPIIADGSRPRGSSRSFERAIVPHSEVVFVAPPLCFNGVGAILDGTLVF